MHRVWQASWLTVLLVGVGLPGASAADRDAAALAAECGAPDLPHAAIDSCLERLRVMDETNPSPRLESLEAGLERRASEDRSSAGPALQIGPPEADGGAANAGVAEAPPQPLMGQDDRDAAPPSDESPSSDGDRAPEADGAPPAERSDSVQQPPAGGGFEDEPPVSDPPDQAQPGDPSAAPSEAPMPDDGPQ
jgi:hypothetical protein